MAWCGNSSQDPPPPPPAPREARGCPGALPSWEQGCSWGSASPWGPGVGVEKPGPRALGPAGPERGCWLLRTERLARCQGENTPPQNSVSAA